MLTFLALAHILDATLRAKEAQLGRKQLESLTLKGRVEADATVIRKVYVSVRSEAWKHHILAWKAKHRNQDLPPYFMGHIRCAGLAEGGDDAELLCVPLPLELQSAGSTYDVQSSELLSKLDVQNTLLFSDGNRAWAKCAQEAGIEWSQVKHCLLQFARTFAKNGRKVTAGTQVIDKMWGHFDDFLPKPVHNKSKATRLIKMWARTCGTTCKKCC